MAGIASISALAVWLGRALGSADLFEDFDFEVLGITIPDAVPDAAGVQAAISHAASAATDLRAATAALETAAAGDGADQLPAIVAFGSALRSYAEAAANLASAVQSAITAAVSDENERATALRAANGLATALADAALGEAILYVAPELWFVLNVFGLADWGQVDGVVVRRLRLERLSALFDDPATHLRGAYGWGADTFDPLEFFRLYRLYFPRERSITIGSDNGNPFIRQGPVTVRRDSTVTPPGLAVEFLQDYAIEAPDRQEVSDDWGVTLSVQGSLAIGAIASIRPPLSIDVTAPLELRGELKLFADRNPDVDPIDLLSGIDVLAVSIVNAALGIGVTADWQPAGHATVQVLPFAELTGVKVTLGSADADSFIGELLGGNQISGTFDLTLEWSADHGLRVRASGGLEVRLPVHRSLGPVTLDSIYLAQRIGPDGTLRWEVSAGLHGAFGPLTAAVDRVGATLDLHMAGDNAARYGRFDLDLGFKPPTGVGLSIDAGFASGGGYLSYDPDNAQYAGVLELSLLDYVTVKAIGLITTRLPDGSRGFSLLLIISAEFGAGIQLGFGFTLLGVGGLLGLNRSMRLQPLIAAVRTGAIESVMFPTNVVANAPRIISDLQAFFPPARGVFLIGPMAKIGWGSPPLITLSLSVIVEIPGDVAILGVLKVVLPDEQRALIRLQVNFLGVIEFGARRAWLYAALFESRILQVTIDGEMGVLLSWGDPADFVVSVGGFHPQFVPPALPFPVPKRIASTILDADYGRIRVAGYLAVTSNTVQFGALADLHFGLSSASIDGHLSFDALFHFNPFSFAIDISAQAAVKFFGIGLFSVGLRFTLSGPSPWRATGYGEISLLFWSKKVNFDITWGDALVTALPSIAVLPLLMAEYGKAANWRALVPPTNRLGVSLRQLPDSEDELVLHPLGRLAISQRAVPLDLDLTRVGGRAPADGTRFSVGLDGTDLVRTADVVESFAIGQFADLDDAAVLSAPAFQPLPGGLEAAPPGVDFRTGNATLRTVRYETVVVDRQPDAVTTRHDGYPGGLFTHFLAGNATARSAPSRQRRAQLAPFVDKVAVAGDGYVVTTVKDNSAFAATVFASHAQAAGFLAEQLALAPRLAGALQVVAAHEMAAP